LVKPVRKSELLEAIAAAIAARGQTHSSGSKTSRGPAPLTPISAFDGPSLNILLVEDSPDNRLLVQAFLRQTRCRVIEAESGEIGLSKFKQEPFDLVLMDIQMPVMDGLEATRAIREWESLHQLPVTTSLR
jgi:two-component system sensor histidine kinase/response regulator